MPVKAERKEKPKAAILAAGVGSRIRPLTDDKPKSLIEVAASPILKRMLKNIAAAGIEEVVLVTGYLAEMVEKFALKNSADLKVSFVHNERYSLTNTAYSLMLLKDELAGSSFIKFDADVVFEAEILNLLMTEKRGSVLLLDREVHLDKEEVKVQTDDLGRVKRVGKGLDPKRAAGESIGIEMITRGTSKLLFDELEVMMADPANHNAYYEAAYERLIDGGEPFFALDITGLNWVEIDTYEDFYLAQKLFSFTNP